MKNRILITCLLLTCIMLSITSCSQPASDIVCATKDEIQPIKQATPDTIQPTKQATPDTIQQQETTIQVETLPVYDETEPITEDVESIYDTPSPPESTYADDELDLVARTVYLEAGDCGEYCQWLVGSTILNLAERNGGIGNVVNDYNLFNVAPFLYDCTPSDLSYEVANRVLSGDRDYNVMAFRMDYYHDFGQPYTSVDNTYFSTY